MKVKSFVSKSAAWVTKHQDLIAASTAAVGSLVAVATQIDKLNSPAPEPATG